MELRGNMSSKLNSVSFHVVEHSYFIREYYARLVLRNELFPRSVQCMFKIQTM